MSDRAQVRGLSVNNIAGGGSQGLRIGILRSGTAGLIRTAASLASGKSGNLADHISGGQSVRNGIFATISAQEQGRTVHAQQEGAPAYWRFFNPFSSS